MRCLLQPYRISTLLHLVCLNSARVVGTRCAESGIVYKITLGKKTIAELKSCKKGNHHDQVSPPYCRLEDPDMWEIEECSDGG
ncbi:uncharacterized protein BJ212DRAFT_1308269 [Suillus subaureus]|uniref:Secreted protein n=1 Tax=Suillus subaureus TaxID=48587 RepID=A0A9P7ENN7_9AGAM|nr:uncharacterized protein BJ212DRAFT_1308269 [Suillus subaureus]KAG1826789.1 hypothetical protein BJ212DRAFT_1308269 [Suillus subaureus]